MIPLRPSSDEEIERYYREEFPARYKDLPPFIQYSPEYAFALKRAIDIELNGKPEKRDFVRRGNDGLFHDLHSLCIDLKKFDPLRQARSSQPVLGLYFGVKDIKNYGWLLWFDIDSKDVARNGLCDKHPGIPDDATDDDIKKWEEMISDIPPKGYKYCYDCVKVAVRSAFRLKGILSSYGFNEKNIFVYYSGQGAHVHVLDDYAWRMPRPSREFLVDMIEQKENEPIDRVVTARTQGVCRIPYSLNAKVSRIVIPLTSPTQDFLNESVPRFLL